MFLRVGKSCAGIIYVETTGKIDGFVCIVFKNTISSSIFYLNVVPLLGRSFIIFLRIKVIPVHLFDCLYLSNGTSGTRCHA